MQDVDDGFAVAMILRARLPSVTAKARVNSRAALTMNDVKEGDTNVIESADALKRKKR